MARRPSIKDVAGLAGVSTATVSHVINHTRFAEPATAARVERAIAELHYVNNGWARMLRSEKSDIIGMLIAGLSNPYAVPLTNCALEQARARGYQLFITPISNSDPDHNERALSTLLSYRVAGVLSMPFDPPVLRSVINRLNGVPFGCIEGDPDLSDTVTTDHEDAAYRATRLLAERYRRIGFVMGAESFETSRARLRGYRRALEDAGIPPRPEYVANGESDVRGGHEAALRLLRTDMEALFVGNNLMLQGALSAIAGTDSRLFGRLAIVGFDDQDWYSFYRPSITAIRQPLPEMVEAAVELLFQRMEHPDRPIERRVLPTELIRRESF